MQTPSVGGFCGRVVVVVARKTRPWLPPCDYWLVVAALSATLGSDANFSRALYLAVLASLPGPVFPYALTAAVALMHKLGDFQENRLPLCASLFFEVILVPRSLFLSFHSSRPLSPPHNHHHSSFNSTTSPILRGDCVTEQWMPSIVKMTQWDA
jgi:hypothetical protein